jgi:UDP-N-acetylmuramoyl-tripeptide--D-alanyl-D-alanine ligase
MVAAVLEPVFPVHRTPGNFNNHLGVPVTLLGLTRRHRAAVVELGMNAPGEIAALAALAAPQVGVLTGVGRAHLAGLGSRSAIISAKLELAAALGRDGRLLLPADDPELLAAARGTGTRLLTVSLAGAAADLVAEAIRVDETGVRFDVRGLGLDGLQVTLAVPARVLVTNALLALAAGATLAVPGPAMAAALARMKLPARRLTVRRAGPLLVLDDCYNANPESMAAALATLGALALRRRIAVLGDMRELGSFAREAHAELGARAAAIADRLYVVGDEAETVAGAAQGAGMAAGDVVVAADVPALIARLIPDLIPGDGVLVKASRALGFEAVVEALLAAPLSAGGTTERAGG